MTYGSSHFTPLFCKVCILCFPSLFESHFKPQKCQYIVKTLKYINIYKAMEGYRKMFNEHNDINVLAR